MVVDEGEWECNVERGQLVGPQMPLLGMMGILDKIWPLMMSVNVYTLPRDRSVDQICLGDEIENPNWASRDYMA